MPESAFEFKVTGNPGNAVGQAFVRGEGITTPVMVEEFNVLGEKLVNALHANTPVSSGRLARSTHREMVNGKDPEGNHILTLLINQDAVNPASDHNYFYRHGVAVGVLPQRIPPSQMFLDWVRRKADSADHDNITPSQQRRSAYAIARHIYQMGSNPNPYIQRTVEEQRPAIELASRNIGVSLWVTLVDQMGLSPDYQE